MHYKRINPIESAFFKAPFSVSGSLRQFCLPADHFCLLCVLSYWREIKQDGGELADNFSFEQKKPPAFLSARLTSTLDFVEKTI